MKVQIKLLIFALTVSSSLQRSTFHEVEREDDDITSNNSTVPEQKCKCNWFLLRHYEAKGCRPSHVDACGCPVAFDCSNANEIGGDKVCHYKGRDYSAGALIDTKNSCELCHCSRNPEAHIVCRSTQCPIAKRPLEPNCHHVYAKDLCCPQAIVCIKNEESQNTQSAACEYNGQSYPFGAKIHSKDDPCETCLCTADWNGMTNSSHCYYEDCVLEKDTTKLFDGCVPVYKENVCCPTEFFCAQDEPLVNENKTTVLNENENTKCLLGDNLHPLGETLLINHETNCVKCKCETPPDFTCVEQICKPNPHEEFCKPYYLADSCCPQYDCLYRDAIPSNTSENDKETDDETEDFMGSENPCNAIKCRTGKTCILHEIACENETCPLVPICTNFGTDCPTPQCANDCYVSLHANGCPTCSCGREILEKRELHTKCRTPQCDGQNCHLSKKASGCFECLCEEPCNLNCPQGCNVLAEVEGKCPRCICEDETVGCPTPICAHRDCHIETPENGCPTCVCDTVRETERKSNERNTFNPQQQQQTNVESEFDSRSLDSPGDDAYDSLIVMGRGQRSSRDQVQRRTEPRYGQYIPRQRTIQMDYERPSRGNPNYTQKRNAFRHISQERIDDGP